MKKLILLSCLLISGLTLLRAQVEIARESFENSGGHGYTTIPDQECFCCDGANVAWYRKEASSNDQCYGSTNGGDGDYYWAAEHSDRLVGNPSGDEAIIQLDKIAVSNFDELEVRFMAGHGIMNEVERQDYMKIQYAMDADIATGNYTTVSEFFGWSTDNEEFAYDTNADGFLDGDTLTQTFQEFIADLAGVTGDTLSVRFTFYTDGFGEDFSLDNIRVMGNQVPLPLNLLAFSVSKEKDAVNINWQTVNEIDLDRFELQRSTDLRNWQTIHQQIARGDGRYQYQDKAVPHASSVYYRLQWIDLDGTSGLSPVRVFSSKLPYKVGKLSPNPFDGSTLQVPIETDRDQLVNWSLRNALGQIQQTGQLQLDNKQERYTLGIEDLPAGIYYWQLEINGTMETRKLVKQAVY